MGYDISYLVFLFLCDDGYNVEKQAMVKFIIPLIKVLARFFSSACATAKYGAISVDIYDTEQIIILIITQIYGIVQLQTDSTVIVH